MPALVGRGQALLELGRDGDALASFEAARQGRPVAHRSAGTHRRAALPRGPGQPGARESGERCGPLGRGARRLRAGDCRVAGLGVSLSRSRARRAQGGRAGAGARALPQGGVARCQRRAVAGADWRASSRSRATSPARSRPTRRRASIDPAEVVPPSASPKLREREALAKLPAEYRAIPVVARRPRAPTWRRSSASGWAARWRAGAPAPGGGHRRAQPLGAAVDHRRRPRRRHGHAAQLHVSAERARAARRSRADRVARARPDCGRQARRRPRRGRARKQKIADVPPGHLSYPAVSQAVASGVMPLDDNGTFQLLATGHRRRGRRGRRAARSARRSDRADLHARQPAHAAADAAHSGVRAAGGVRLLRLGADRVSASPARPMRSTGSSRDRPGRRPTLGAWLDPAADKLLLVTTFVVLDAAESRPGQPHPDLADGARHQPRRRHRPDRGDRQPGHRAAHVQAVAARQGRDGVLHRDLRGRDVFQLPRHGRRSIVDAFIWGSLAITLVSGIDYVFRVARDHQP